MKGLIPTSVRMLGLQFAILCLAAAFSGGAQAKQPTFEEVFNVKGEPRALHFQAVFSSKGTEHQLEVWRAGDTRLKRNTDQVIETYVFRQPGSNEFKMSVLDKKKKIHTRVDRTNLYRIGNFTDWFDLAHGLRHPVGAYTIAKGHAPAGVPKAVESCHWYDLTQNNRTTHICWSRESSLPVVIAAQDGGVLWRLTGLDTKPIPAGTFNIQDAGYVRNDANEDIEGD